MARSSSSLRLWRGIFPVPLVVLALVSTGWLDPLERWTTDWRFRLRGDVAVEAKVAYVDVDSQSIADLGNQPWDRSYFAEVAQALLEHGRAKAVGIDYVFSDNGMPDLVDADRFEAGKAILAEYLNQAPPPPVVVAASYAATVYRDLNGQVAVRELPTVDTPVEQASLPELPEFRIGGLVWGAPYVGLIDTLGGETRAVHAFAEVGPLRWHHLAVELARLSLGLPPGSIQRTAEALELRNAEGVVVKRIPLREGQIVEVNWFTRWMAPEHQSHASFSQALVCARILREGGTPEEIQVAREFYAPFADSVVLIGPVDPLLQDIAPTPLDPLPVPRVGLHGNLYKTIMSERYLSRPGPWGTAAAVLLLTVVVSGAALASGRYRAWFTGVALAATGAYLVAALLLFLRHDYLLPVVAPIISAFTATSLGLLLRVASEERQRRRIQGLFGTYLSPELVDRMVESGEEPRLGGQEVEITAYFSDIENFTQLAESLPPASLVELMNEYLTECTDAVTKAGGTLDKYIGDAVVAMYGAPVPLADHAWRACYAAALVQERLQELRARWSLDPGRWPGGVPVVATRIGLASGPAVVGNMGSSTRFNYTMMGDTVNLAARLESAAKHYGAWVLVAGATRTLCIQKKDTLVFRPLDRLQVKGKSLPVEVFELLGRRDQIAPETRACAVAFAAGLEAYYARDFLRARELFQEALPAEPNEVAQPGSLSPSRVFLSRCEHWLAQPPPAEWDGSWVLEHK